MLLAGLSTGVPVYYALAALAGALLVLCALSAILLRGSARVRVRAANTHIRRGESVALHISLSHRCFLPTGAAVLLLDTPEGTDTLAADCPPGKTAERETSVVFPHRGVYRTGVTALEASDPFGLFRLRRNIGNALIAIEVTPRIRTEQAKDLGSGETGPESRVRATEDNASPSGLRTWREGDELKKVHWKMSMRRRELIVRTYEEAARPDVLILPDCTPIRALASTRLSIEDAITGEAASCACAYLQAGYPVRMPLSGTRPTECAGRTPEELGAFLSALTTMVFDSGYAFETSLAVEMRRMQRTGGAVIITSRLNARIADIAMQMRRGGMHVELRWVSESRGTDGNGIAARLALAGVEVKRVIPNE